MKIVAGDNSYKQGDIIRFQEIGKEGNWYLIVGEDRTAGPFSTEYTMLPLSLSKWKLIRSIQLWALRKAFSKL